jgi:Amt family ammonium transporter
LLGARKGKYSADGKVNAIPGANMPLAAIGMFILWMGWFGFNGGSQLIVSNIADANAVSDIFVNTNAAAAGGLIAALVLAQLLYGKADLTMAVNGALAGLVSITAEPLAWTGGAATLVGAVGGIIVVFSVKFMDSVKIDDPVGAISVHGVVGIWGLLAVCFSGNDSATLIGQLTGIVVIFAWTFVTSFIVWSILKAVMGIRITEEQEFEGCDIAECGIEAYPEFSSGK